MNHIVKRRGHEENYDERKLYASIYSSAVSVKEPIKVAEIIASEVVDNVNNWLKLKPIVTSNDIRRIAGRQLSAISSNAGYQYLHHRVIN
jgi:transcriptional regulator NrdR family protein